MSILAAGVYQTGRDNTIRFRDPGLALIASLEFFVFPPIRKFMFFFYLKETVDVHRDPKMAILYPKVSFVTTAATPNGPPFHQTSSFEPVGLQLC